MKKLQLLTAAITSMTPTNSVAPTLLNQSQYAKSIFANVLTNQQINKDKFLKDLRTKLGNAAQNKSIPGLERLKYSQFYIYLDQKKSIGDLILNSLFNDFKNKEPEAFIKDPTKSFINYVLEKFQEKIKNANEVENISDVTNIINSFISDINHKSFLDNFSTQNKGKQLYENKVKDHIKDIAKSYNIDVTSLDRIQDIMFYKFGEIISDVAKYPNNYQNKEEPYFKKSIFEDTIDNKIKDEWEKIKDQWVKDAKDPLVANGIQKTVTDEFTALLKNSDNINNNFSRKTVDYLKYYLKNQEGTFDPNIYSSDNEYFFKKIFGEDINNWKPDVKKFWDKWFRNKKNPNIDINIRYMNFENINSKAKMELSFNVKLNKISAIFNSKSYEINYKSSDNWNWVKAEKMINDYLINLNDKTITELGNDGFKISEDPNDHLKDFWNVLDKQLNLNLQNSLFSTSILKETDFNFNIIKQPDQWIFNISIDKNFGDGTDPVEDKYDQLNIDNIIDITFQTAIYDIKQNLLQVDSIITNPNDEQLKRSPVYKGIYQDDLNKLLEKYPKDTLIPLEELQQGKILRKLLATTYSEAEINKFISYIRNISLEQNKYSMNNSPGGIGQIGYKYIKPTNEKGYFQLFIENVQGAVQTPVQIDDKNLKIYNYQNKYDRFKQELENMDIKNGKNLEPDEEISTSWNKLKQIMPMLSSDDANIQGEKFYLDTFARIFGLVNNSLENHLNIVRDDNTTKVVFNLNDGQKYEKIIFIDSLSQQEKDDFTAKTNARLDEVKDYIYNIKDSDIKDKMKNIYKKESDQIKNLLNNMKTSDDIKFIDKKFQLLLNKVTNSIITDEQNKLMNEVKKKYPNGIPEDVQKRIEDFLGVQINDILNKSPKEIRDILDNRQDLYKDLREENVNIDDLLNINQQLNNFEKYGIIALGGILAADSVVAGGIAYGISRKNKKLSVTNKQKMKRSKSLILFNIIISLLTAGGAVAMFILIFIIKGGI